MKKIFILLLLLSTILFASSSAVEAKIYNSIFSAFFPYKNIVRVWVDKESKRDILQRIANVRLVSSMGDADICLIMKSKDIKTNKLIFVGSYSLLKHYKESTLGGFFWQKGRPNILFLKENLEKFNVKLPSRFSKYIENDL